MVSLNLRPGEGRGTRVSRRRRPQTVSVRRLTRERGGLVVINGDDNDHNDDNDNDDNDNDNDHNDDNDNDDNDDNGDNGDNGDAGEVPGPHDDPPTSRSQCKSGYRPCPFVSCRFHLYLDVTEHGALRLNFPGQEPWEMKTSCALDVAEAGEGLTLEALGALLNLTRERARQIERLALAKVNRGIDEGPQRG